MSEIVDTDEGPVLPSGARFCLGTIAAIDLIVAYGIADTDGDVLAAAVTVHPGSSVSVGDLDTAMARLPRRCPPRDVQVVELLPMTAWHRPIWRDLQLAGVPCDDGRHPVWRLDPVTGRYRFG